MRGWAAPSSGGAPQSPGGVSKPPEWKECGTRWAISKFHFCVTLPENEARGLVPCHLFSSPSDHLRAAKEDHRGWEETGRIFLLRVFSEHAEQLFWQVL